MSKMGVRSEVSQGVIPEVRLGGRLGEMSLARQVAVLAAWPLLEQILAFCVGLTDLLIAGRITEGPEGVAIMDAMGLAGYVSWFFNILQGAVATGVMALVARAVGARDEELARRGLGQGLWLGLLAGGISLALLWLGKGLLIRAIGLGPQAAVHAEAFLSVLAFSGPLSGVLFAMNAALRGAGDTRTPFVGMAVVNLVNMGLSCLLVFGPEPFGGHGVAGIAWGTLGGWLAGLLTVGGLLARKGGVLHWTKEGVRPHRETIWRIARVGAPQSMEIGLMWGIHAFGIHCIASLPTAGALGAHILAIRVESMSFLPGWAIAMAGAALVGQYLGAGSKEMAVRAVRLCWKVAAGLMGCMGVVFVLWRGPLIAMMAPKSPELQQMAMPLVLICAAAQPFFATCIILKNSMRGAGATRIVMKASFGSMIFYRVLMLWLLKGQDWFDLRVVWWVFSIDLFTQALIFAMVHFRGKWLDAKV